jgi:hypothetical protein
VRPRGIERVVIVVASPRQQFVDKSVAASRQISHLITASAHSPQQIQQTRRRVESNGVAGLSGFARRVSEDECNSFFGVWLLPESHQARGNTRDSGDPLRVRRVKSALKRGFPFFKGNRHADDSAVELRNRDIDRRLEWAQAAR